MNWLAKIFYRRRVSRLEAVQTAAKLMSLGRIDEANELLERNAPSRYLMDVAVYHFIKGRLALEEGKWKEAQEQLSAAKVLGVESSTLHFCLGMLEVRRHDFEAAKREFLMTMRQGGAGKPIEERVLEIEGIISRNENGESLKEIKAMARSFSQEKLDSPLEKGTNFKVFENLESYLRDQRHGQPLGEEKRRESAALLGELAVQTVSAHWLLGLNMHDHVVVFEGKKESPYQAIEDFLGGNGKKLLFFNNSLRE